MSNVEQFPAKGILRNENGDEIGAWYGGTQEAAEERLRDMKSTAASLTVAHDIAVQRGYESLFDVPEQERFEIVSEAKKRTSPAND